MTDREALLALLDVFESALSDFTGLVRELRDDEWELPTDLAGWTVPRPGQPHRPTSRRCSRARRRRRWSSRRSSRT
jgi:hypothetical protein